MKVTIDREECIDCGVCYAECPEVFEEDDSDSTSQIVGACGLATILLWGKCQKRWQNVSRWQPMDARLRRFVSKSKRAVMGRMCV